MVSDVTAPVLEAISLDLTTLNLDEGDNTVVVEARFTDDLSGVFDGEFADGTGGSPPQILMTSPSGQVVFGLFDILNPVSGDRNDGVYRATLTLGPYAEQGVWTVSSLLLSDEAGNLRVYSPDTDAILEPVSFAVQNANSDTVPPNLVSISLSDTVINIGNGETSFVVTARLQDALSGVFDGTFYDGLGGSPPQLLFEGPSGQVVFAVFDIDNPVSGDIHDGVFRATVTLSEFSESGTWTLQSFLLNDEAGNLVSLGPLDSPLLENLAFEVVNEISDNKAPKVLALDLGSPALDSEGRPHFSVTAHFTDNTSGIFDGTYADGLGGSPPQIRFVSSTGQIVTGIFDILDPVSGDRLDGVYAAPLTLSPFAEAGTWRIDYLLVNDEAGNLRILTPETDPELLGATIYIGSDLPDSIAGTSDPDSIYGFGGDDNLGGGGGDDILNGGDGDDTVSAGGGDDSIVGGSGAGDDRYNGNQGFDTVVYTSATTGIVVDLKKGKATGSEIGKDSLKAIEGVVGGQAGDKLTGDGGKNVLDGYTGNDVLVGGAGRDAFVFSTVPGKANADRIKDFTPDDDTIHLDDAIFDGLKVGKLKAGAFFTGRQAKDNNDRIGYDKKTGLVHFDANGKKGGGESVVAKLDTGLDVTHRDFLVV